MYWRTREERNKKQNIKTEKQEGRAIKRIYNSMYNDIETQIYSFYARYAVKEGLTLAEAKQRVSQLDIEAYERKARAYVRSKTKTEQANAEMRLYNLTMKVSRLELLKAEMSLSMIRGFDDMEERLGRLLTEKTASEFERQAGVLGETVFHNSKMINSIVNASFYNATFSDNIWHYQGLLKANLDILLQRGLIQGKNPRVLVKDLQKEMNSSFKDSYRLMCTEYKRVQTDAQLRSLKENGYKYYEFMANTGACPVCVALDGKTFKISEAMYGENAPPIHPYCRCSVAGSMGENWEEEYDKWINAKGFDGSFREWQGNDNGNGRK